MAKKSKTSPSEKLSNTGSKASDCIVEPIIRSNGEKHILETLYESGSAPEIKAIGYTRMGKGPNAWVSYVATIKGDKVIKIQVDEPNMRGIAEESAKINFVTEFIDQELL